MPKVFITGITQGIGRACGERFRAGGWQVSGCARNTQRLALMGRQWPEAQLHRCDLADEKDRNLLISKLLETSEPPDVLINNAGMFVPGSIGAEEAGVYERTLALNLTAPYHLIRALLPGMKACGSGTIVNLSSTAGLVGYPNGGSYCISKFGLMGLTRALREELKSTDIRVIAVMPGATLTASWEGTDLPANRFMVSEAVAEMIFCASNLPAGTVVEDIVMRPQQGDIV